jgi:hypothetical protein
VELSTVKRQTRRPKSAQRLACGVALCSLAATSKNNTVVARELRIACSTTDKWRSRFVAERLEGLHDEPRPRTPRTISHDDVKALIVKTSKSPHSTPSTGTARWPQL